MYQALVEHKNNNMNKTDIARKISDDMGLDIGDTKAIVNQVFEEIHDCILRGENFNFRGVGTLMLKDRQTTLRQDLTTKKTVRVPAHKYPFMKISRQFRAKVRELHPLKDDKRKYREYL